MSYDLNFNCGPLKGEHHLRGGTHAVGGTTQPWLNITYNYSPFFREFWPEGIRSLYGMTAREVILELDTVIPQMEGEPSDNYWEAIEGNAKAALVSLKKLAELCPPESVLNGD